MHSYKTHALEWSDGLAESCREHVLDTGPCSMTGHNGFDGSTASQRADRYIAWWGTGENIAYAKYEDTSGMEVIIQFVVDDGVTSRGHRRNIFKNSFTHTGVACGCHAYYGDVCCIQYGRKITDNGPALTSIPRPPTQSDPASCKAHVMNPGGGLTWANDDVPVTQDPTTYSQMAVDLYNELNSLRSDPTTYHASVSAAAQAVTSNFVSAGP